MSQSKHIASTFKHALIYGTAGMLGKAIGFIMLPVYAHYLRGDGYGIIGMIDVVLSVLTLMIGYGVKSAMSRFYYEKKKEAERKVLVSTALILMFFLVVLVSAPVLLFNEQVAWLAFGKEGLGYYITLAILTFMATMTSGNAEAYILIRQQSVFFSILSLCKLVFSLIAHIYFIVVLEMGVLGYLYAGLLTACASTLTMHAIAFIHVGWHFNRDDVNAILRFSLPLLPGYAAMFIRINADRVILRTFLGLTMLGAFEMLFKFATLLGFFIVEPFMKIWSVKRFEIADKKEGPATMAAVFTLHFGVMLFTGLVLSLEIPVLLRIMTPEEFWLPGYIVFFAVLSRVIMACYYQFYFGLLYAKKTYKISIIQWCSALVSVAVNLVLIKPFGIAGAVVASCIANFIQCSLGYYLARSFYPIPFEWSRIVKMIIFAGTLFVAIDFFTFEKVDGLQGFLDGHVVPPLMTLMHFFHLDGLRDGKLLSYLVTNIVLVFDGGVKFLLSFSFLGGLFYANILPRQKVVAVIKARSLKPLTAD